MGGSASKPVRQFPKSTKPSTWAGARTPHPEELRPRPNSTVPQASETKTTAIEQDSKDPQLAANLNRLGPVRVDNYARTVRPPSDRMNKIFQGRLQSEVDARSSQTVRNRLLASSMVDLLNERKTVNTREELEKLATRYNIDVVKLESMAEFVSSPSIDQSTVVKTVDQDGVERITMKAVWVDPPLQPHRPKPAGSGA